MPGTITVLLDRIARGTDADRKAAENELYAGVYEHLHGRAERLMRGERRNHTLQATALVNEAYLRFVGRFPRSEKQNRLTFFAAASHAMRNILVDHARRHKAKIRGGGWNRMPLPDELKASSDNENVVDLLVLDEALNELERLNPRQAQIVELCFFGGLTEKEIAEFLGVSERLVQGDWRAAKAFLWSKLK